MTDPRLENVVMELNRYFMEHEAHLYSKEINPVTKQPYAADAQWLFIKYYLHEGINAIKDLLQSY